MYHKNRSNEVCLTYVHVYFTNAGSANICAYEISNLKFTVCKLKSHENIAIGIEKSFAEIATADIVLLFLIPSLLTDGLINNVQADYKMMVEDILFRKFISTHPIRIIIENHPLIKHWLSNCPFLTEDNKLPFQ